MVMLEVENLRKSYGKLVALDGVTFSTNEGEILVIMGPSGCGKSTLIRSINRLVEPDSGIIRVNGIDVTSLAHWDLLRMRKKIGYVFQHFNLIERLTVLENVMFGQVLAGMDWAQAQTRALQILERVGLDSRLNHRPSELSGGEKQRVGLARAMVTEPELMLLDEPTAALDPIMVGEVLNAMEELVRTWRTTMVIVTHEVRFTQRIADRVILMNRGRIEEEGSPDRIFTSPSSELGKRYKALIA